MFTDPGCGSIIEMASVFTDYACLSRIFFFINTIGDVFLTLRDFTTVVKRFVYGEETQDDLGSESNEFGAEISSLLQLCPGLLDLSTTRFKLFHEFSVSCGRPLATVLISSRQVCRKCMKALTVLEKKVHVVTIYHSERGSYLGSRVTKFCWKCKIYEHYGFWTENAIKHVDVNCLDNEFLLSSEDTAFHMSLMRQCASLLVVGAVPFSTFATSYNRRFGYIKQRLSAEEHNSGGSKGTKRMKR